MCDNVLQPYLLKVKGVWKKSTTICFAGDFWAGKGLNGIECPR